MWEERGVSFLSFAAVFLSTTHVFARLSHVLLLRSSVSIQHTRVYVPPLTS